MAHEQMSERPAHCVRMRPRESSSHTTEKAKRSTPGFRLRNGAQSSAIGVACGWSAIHS